MEKEKKMVTVEELTRKGRCGNCGWPLPLGSATDLIWLCLDCGTYNLPDGE